MIVTTKDRPAPVFSARMMGMRLGQYIERVIRPVERWMSDPARRSCVQEVRGLEELRVRMDLWCDFPQRSLRHTTVARVIATHRNEHEALLPVVHYALLTKEDFMSAWTDGGQTVLSFDLNKPLDGDALSGHPLADPGERVDAARCPGLPRDKVFGPFAENRQRFTLRLPGGPGDAITRDLVRDVCTRIAAPRIASADAAMSRSRAKRAAKSPAL